MGFPPFNGEQIAKSSLVNVLLIGLKSTCLLEDLGDKRGFDFVRHSFLIFKNTCGMAHMQNSLRALLGVESGLKEQRVVFTCFLKFEKSARGFRLESRVDAESRAMWSPLLAGCCWC